MLHCMYPTCQENHCDSVNNELTPFVFPYREEDVREKNSINGLETRNKKGEHPNFKLLFQGQNPCLCNRDRDSHENIKSWKFFLGI